jgi:polysaccharide pyruvyl transferase WcaK-like protein
MNIALLSAGLNGTNAGDALIEDAVRRLVVADEYRRFPLHAPLTDPDVDGINGCDAAIVCGTNLYQAIFSCNLTVEAISRIKIPIVPMGVGSSAPIDAIPGMNEEGQKAVRAIHERCALSSVRDSASLRFLHSIGVSNTRLTGCPVLFHGLSCPDFRPSGMGYTLTPRARLLHIDRQWNHRQLETLHLLCRRYHPTLVLQSPHDLPIAEQLAACYGVEVLYDAHWQAAPYIRRAAEQSMAFGFRLHYGMLSLAYGKPAFFVAHDSRVSEFCRLMELPCFDIRDYSDNLLALHIDARSFDGDVFRRRWSELARDMHQFITANGLQSRLELDRPDSQVTTARNAGRKPRILMLADQRGWAFDHSARQIERCLSRDFNFDIRYIGESPSITSQNYDLLYLFFWGDQFYKTLGFASDRTIKELSSHRWEDDPRYGPCTAEALVDRYLCDAFAVCCTSLRLKNRIAHLHPRVYHTPNGFDSNRFHLIRRRSGPMTIGWAGNIDDPVKGVQDVLKPACHGRFNLLMASGSVPHRKMNVFYNRLDVFAITSKHEGEPLTVIEAMAAGCFPVCTDIGIISELVRSGENGLIVSDHTAGAFLEAFEWCESHLDHVRKAGEQNARQMRRERSWEVVAPFYKRVFAETLEYIQRPRFRNDDVSCETPLAHFEAFCRIFWKYNLRQVHGVILRGRTSRCASFRSEPPECRGAEARSHLSNSRIRELAEGFNFEDRKDLIDFLKEGPDEIALHGYYHTDYSNMTSDEQKREIESGLSLLKRLFPNKQIKYFIPPFDRVNQTLYGACEAFGLDVLDVPAVCVEDTLETLRLEPGTWYRYQHHRFYPDSTFNRYKTSLELLDAALGQNISLQPRDLALRPARRTGLMMRMWRRVGQS